MLRLALQQRDRTPVLVLRSVRLHVVQTLEAEEVVRGASAARVDDWPKANAAREVAHRFFVEKGHTLGIGRGGRGVAKVDLLCNGHPAGAAVCSLRSRVAAQHDAEHATFVQMTTGSVFAEITAHPTDRIFSGLSLCRFF